jgi:hypothetical protein
MKDERTQHLFAQQLHVVQMHPRTNACSSMRKVACCERSDTLQQGNSSSWPRLACPPAWAAASPNAPCADHF